MSTTVSKKNVRNLRRTPRTATTNCAARKVPDLMAELQEAEIRARIKQARKEAGLSQPKMADLLEVIPRSVQNYENHHVPWGRIRDIANITGVSTRWLLHGDDTEPDQHEPDRLDRIEQRLNQIYELLSEDGEIAEAIGSLSDQLEAAAESPPRQEPVRSEKRKAAARRSPA